MVDMDPMSAVMGGPNLNDTGYTSPVELKKRLNTAIYEYFLKHGGVDLAELMVKSPAFDVDTSPPDKSNPNRQVNGDSMNMDGKDDIAKRLQSLPVPNMPFTSPDGCFLYDWWTVFFEMFSAQRSRKPMPTHASQYIAQTQNQARQKAFQQQQQRVMQPGMNQFAMANGMPGAMGDLSAQNLQRKAAVNANRSMPLQQGGRNMQQQMQQQPMNQTNMQREGSEQQRPSSPMSGDNAPSPKRPRTDGGTFNGQQMGRPNAPGMQMPNGNGAAAMGPQGMKVYAQSMAAAHNKVANPTPNAGSMQNSPMINAGPENALAMYDNGAVVRAGSAALSDIGATGGQNALHDYQVQLILLEQQNKRRLIQARNEQDMQARDPQMAGPMGVANFAPGMSPQGSRTGQSPNADQMKRGTPQMGTNSPLPDGTMPGQGSPAPIALEGGQMPPNANQFYNMNMGLKPEAMGMAANGMRPPANVPYMHAGAMNPAQMELLRRNGAIPNGLMPGAQMHPPMAAQPQMQQAPQDSQGQRNQMPPPQAPPNSGGNQRQPPSPSQSAAPPTPSQANKPNPKKKDTKDTKKKPPKKGPSTAGATSSAENEQPPTPTPQTPVTPVHPKSFSQNAQGSQSGNAQTSAATETPAAPTPATTAQQDASSANAPFPMDTSSGLGFDSAMDFGALEGTDVLDAFDFSAFLNQDSDTANYDFDPSSFSLTGGEGVETGTGDA